MADDADDAATTGVRALAAAGREVAASAWRVGRLLLCAQLLVMVGGALTPVAAAWLTKQIIDGLAGTSTAPVSTVGLVVLATALAGTGVMVAVLSHAGGYLGGEIGRRFVVDCTDRLFTAVTRLPGLRPFENPRFLDRLRLAQEGTSLGGSLVTEAFATGRALLTVVGFITALLVVSPVVTGIVVLAAAPALLAHLRLSRWRARMLWELSPVERWQALYASLLDSVNASKEIRLFGSGSFLRNRMMEHLRTATAARRRMDRRELSIEALLALLSAVVAGGGLVWAIGAARAGALSPGDITMFITAVAAVQSGLLSLVTSISTVHHGLSLFGHYLAVERAGPDLPVPARPRPLPPLRRGIELRDVWFRYSDDHPWVLRGVNLVIPAGKAVALVGLNGAGKSTLVKLLCRFYDPSEGVILWDGVDLREVSPEALRERISAVFQDPVPYELSAGDNIAIGDVAAYGDLGRVRSAARQVGMDQTLEALPRGYQTLLTRALFASGDDRAEAAGVVLSGGQWQRLAIARAFFRERRDFVIVDEPSAGLDAQAEADLQTQMRRHRAGRTSLLISHRLNTVRDADRLVVLQDGVIAEQGTHPDLIRADGVYARLFHAQAQGYQTQPCLQRTHSRNGAVAPAAPQEEVRPGTR